MRFCTLRFGRGNDDVFLTGMIRSDTEDKKIIHGDDHDYVKSAQVDTAEQQVTILSHDMEQEECDLLGYKEWDDDFEYYISLPNHHTSFDTSIQVLGDEWLGELESSSFKIGMDASYLEGVYDQDDIKEVNVYGDRIRADISCSLRLPDSDDTLGYENPIVVLSSEDPIVGFRY